MANVEIAENLYKKVEERIRGTEFKSVSDYVSFVLRELMDTEEESKLTENEEKDVKERLRSLGYLD